jgi:phospholipid-translocating ATPase
MQASLAADFSIKEFSHLARLILWHGRLSYKRTAALSQFVIHRGMIISFIQAIFTCVYLYVSVPIYNGYLLLGYATCYTTFPIFFIVLDKDVTWEKVQEFPALYQTLQKGRQLNFKTFMIWTWISMAQAAVIMFVAITYFDNSFVNICTITFSTLIFVEMLNVYSEVTSVRWEQIFVTIGTIMFYMGTIILLPTMIEVSIIDGWFMLKVLLLSALTWVPYHLAKSIF